MLGLQFVGLMTSGILIDKHFSLQKGPRLIATSLEHPALSMLDFASHIIYFPKRGIKIYLLELSTQAVCQKQLRKSAMAPSTAAPTRLPPGPKLPITFSR